MEMMESEAGKEFEETRESQDKEEEMISIPSSTQVAISKNDEGNMATTSRAIVIPQKYPLLIDLILESTLSKLSLGDLLSCRLVCQQWNRISTPKVKEKCVELILSADDLTQLVPHHNRSPPWNYFLPTMKKSLSIPCSKFQLQLERSNPDLAAFQELIDVCSNEITSLHLAPLKFKFDDPGKKGVLAPDSNKTTFQNWLKNLKNLAVLTITDLDFGRLSCSSFFEPGNELNLDNLREFHFLGVGTSGNLSSGFFDGFFKAAQNLEKMSFGVKDYRNKSEQFQFLCSDENSDLRTVRTRSAFKELWEKNEEKASEGLNVVLNSFMNHGRLDGIKSLTFHNLNPLNLATLIKFTEKGVKLEGFRALGSIHFGQDGLHHFLETQKDTLKTLDISGGGGESLKTFEIRFPSQMKELRRLTLSTNGPLKITEPICYSDRFPKIRTLCVKSGHRERNYRQNVSILNSLFSEVENLVGCETLKELKMDFTVSDNGRIEEDEIIQRISAIFQGMVIRVRVQRSDDDESLENGQARVMVTLLIFGNRK